MTIHQIQWIVRLLQTLKITIYVWELHEQLTIIMCTNLLPLLLRSSHRHLQSGHNYDSPRSSQCNRVYWRQHLYKNNYQARFGLNPDRSKRNSGKMMRRCKWPIDVMLGFRWWHILPMVDYQIWYHLTQQLGMSCFTDDWHCYNIEFPANNLNF